MNLNSFIAMRQEIFLLTILLLLIVGEIFINKNKKESLVHFAIFLFGIHTIVGFFVIEESSLFGGMFRTNTLIGLKKKCCLSIKETSFLCCCFLPYSECIL